MSKRLGRVTVTAATLLLVLCAGSITAMATVAKQMTLEQLVETSDRIVRGVVEARHAQWSDRHNLVITRTTLKVNDTYWGDETSSVTIEQFGGEANDVHTVIEGDASFHVGEEVIVFLNNDRKNPDSGLSFLTSLAQSKYTVQRAERGDFTVRRDLEGLSIYTDEGTLVPAGADVRSGESFLAELRTLVAGIKGGAQ